jgi:hypothetical protein
MWTDPLDELIADLEEVVAPTPSYEPLWSFEELIHWTDILLYRPNGAKELDRSPAYRDFQERVARSMGKAPRHDPIRTVRSEAEHRTHATPRAASSAVDD